MPTQSYSENPSWLACLLGVPVGLGVEGGWWEGQGEGGAPGWQSLDLSI